ncbi:MAG TPA: DUF6498-containing protein [Rhodanobacteraceae bacterium]|jgi:hypothetical protein|nr:DUF6498-containing protein [Rhodanobacteraceae bacterium]
MASDTRRLVLPSFSEHVRELASRRDAWLIVVRNLIPVVGIYFFGWSAGLSVFNYWFDGLTALAAIVAALVPRAMRETPDKSRRPRGPIKSAVVGVATWAFLVAIVGLPYWIVLMPLGDLMLAADVRQHIAHSPVLWATFGGLAASHFWKAFHLGYDAMPEEELKQRVRWDVYLLILRAVAMLMMVAHGLAFVIVPLMAIVLSYFEIWPERVLRATFGDPANL